MESETTYTLTQAENVNLPHLKWLVTRYHKNKVNLRWYCETKKEAEEKIKLLRNGKEKPYSIYTKI